MVARTFSASLYGVEGKVIEIEAASKRGNATLTVTGLPSPLIKESISRIQVCLHQFGFEVPSGRLIVHLIPAATPKQGTQFDLAIAMSILGAEAVLGRVPLHRCAFLGELTLDGSVRSVAGVLALTQVLIRREGIDAIFVPASDEASVSLLSSQKIFLVQNIADILDFFSHGKRLSQPKSLLPPPWQNSESAFDQVVGQSLGKRALAISLAGRHSLLFVGAPGVGKTMLAECAPSLLLPLDGEEWIQVVKNHAGNPSELPAWGQPPFRSPHHTVSGAAMLGGGSGTVIPGEVTLAHGGILFLDEFPEFRREALEGLREPLQNGKIHLHRIGRAMTLPARFTLLAAMNPCPCGLSLSPEVVCRCSFEKIKAYRKRLSGPILDRMALCVVFGAPVAEEGEITSREKSFEDIRRAVIFQRERYGAPQVRNGDATENQRAVPAFGLGPEETLWFEKRLGEKKANSRASLHLVRVARTIADMEESERIRLPHLQEAWSLRCFSLFSSFPN